MESPGNPGRFRVRFLRRLVSDWSRSTFSTLYRRVKEHVAGQYGRGQGLYKYQNQTLIEQLEITPDEDKGIRQIGAMLHAKAGSATVVKPVGFATGNGKGSRRRIRTRIALQNPVAQVVVAILWVTGLLRHPDRGHMGFSFARLCRDVLRPRPAPVAQRLALRGLVSVFPCDLHVSAPPNSS